MTTQTHNEALHPRETTGKFATKPTSEAAGGMDALAPAAQPDVKALKAAARAAFRELLEADPTAAYEVYGSFETRVRDAEYPRFEVVQEPAEDGDDEDEPVTYFKFDGKHYNPENLVSVDIAQRHTSEPEVDADGKGIAFDYSGEGPDWSGLVYLLNDKPVRLPEGWTED